MGEFSKAEERLVIELVEHYRENNAVLKTFLQSLESQINGSSLLTPYTHTLKARLKDPLHLKDKLERKLREAKEKRRPFGVSKKNLFVKVNDLAGVRILHLHTQQAADIDKGLKHLFEEESYRLVEGPLARTWDDESRALFKSIDIKTKKSPSLYTSIHYVIRPNRKTPYTCEIQVRTLMEEVWGEVNHSINYPHESKSLPCREQIAALARATRPVRASLTQYSGRIWTFRDRRSVLDSDRFERISSAIDVGPTHKFCSAIVSDDRGLTAAARFRYNLGLTCCAPTVLKDQLPSSSVERRSLVSLGARSQQLTAFIHDFLL